MAKIISYDPMILSGKIGDRVYYSRNGKNYSRKLPVHKEKITSEHKLPQQEKFSRLSRLLMPLTPLFRSSFKIYTLRMSGYNKAISSNYQNGFIGENPLFDFDFSKLLLGDGFVASAKLMTVKSNGSGALTFTWKGKRGRGTSRRSDHLYVAVFCQTLNTWIYETNAALRSAGTCTINVPAFSGNPVHIYVGFISRYGGDASPSEYLGMVNIL
jgi:hypothetical protein